MIAKNQRSQQKIVFKIFGYLNFGGKINEEESTRGMIQLEERKEEELGIISLTSLWIFSG